MEDASALFASEIANAEQSANMRPATAILRIGEDIRRAGRKDEPGTRPEIEAPRLGLGMHPHYAGNGIPIGDAKPGKLKPASGFHKFFGMDRPFQKGKVRPRPDLDEDGVCHAKTPCINQRGISASGS